MRSVNEKVIVGQKVNVQALFDALVRAETEADVDDIVRQLNGKVETL